jgi:ML domain
MFGGFLSRLAVFLATVPFFGSVQDCAPGESLFTITELSLSPAAPVAGQNLTLHLGYEVPEGVSVLGGTAEYDVTYNYIPFSPSTEPLCSNIPCPLGPGTYLNESTSQWPDSLSGLLVSRMKWFDEQNSMLLCVEISGQTGNSGAESPALGTPPGSADLRQVALVSQDP